MIIIIIIIILNTNQIKPVKILQWIKIGVILEMFLSPRFPK